MASANGEHRAQSRGAKAACFVLLLMLFCAGPVAEFRNLTALKDSDVWWRLRTGVWIAQKHSVPHQGLFSRAEALPWTAPGWLFDLLLAGAHRVVGYAALPLAVMLASCALAVVLFVLASGAKAKNSLAGIAVAAVALWADGLPPCGPVALSKVFYGVELALLLHIRRTGDRRALYALPALFFVWANFAPEFICGFLPLLLLILLEALRPWVPSVGEGNSANPPLPALGAVAVGCFLASLFTPYTYHLYTNFIDELYSTAGFKYFSTMTALGFRQPRDFVLAFFLLSAFFVLGRRRDVYLFVLLLLSLPVAFRIQRDTWIAILPATAALALLRQQDSIFERRRARPLRSPLTWAAAVSLLATLVFGVALLSPARMERTIAEQFPVHAAQFARAHRTQGPLFNLTAWGGFLTYALPEYPVAIDDRVALYGDSAYIQMRQLENAEIPLSSVEALVQARLLMLPADSALAKALTLRPELSAHYDVLYRDQQAVVLQAR